MEAARAEKQEPRNRQDLPSILIELLHDLREPLRTIRCYTELLAPPARTTGDGREDWLLGRITEAVTRIQRLVDDVADFHFADTPASEPGPGDMEEALRIALANLEVAIRETDAVITTDPLPTIPAKNGAWDRVFQNLIANAIKYRTEYTPRIRVGCFWSETEWVFSVSDNGFGIAAADHENIFIPLRRLHSRETYPGSGLGLAICKRIVESHGGRIWVESTPGAGSTFRFTIPVFEGLDLEASKAQTSSTQDFEARHGISRRDGGRQSDRPALWRSIPSVFPSGFHLKQTS